MKIVIELNEKLVTGSSAYYGLVDLVKNLYNFIRTRTL